MARETVGACILTPEGSIVAFRRSKNKKKSVGKWQFVQGGIEKFDADIETSLYREIEEEVGLKKKDLSDPEKVIVHRYKPGNREVVIYWYLLFWSDPDIAKIKLDNQIHQEFDMVSLTSWEFLLENCPEQKLQMYIALREAVENLKFSPSPQKA